MNIEFVIQFRTHNKTVWYTDSTIYRQYGIQTVWYTDNMVYRQYVIQTVWFTVSTV